MKGKGFLADFKAIIFDLDGVLIDSEGLHAEAKRITLDHFHISFGEKIFSDFKGRPDTAFFDFVSDELTGGRYPAAEMNEFKWHQYQSMATQVRFIPGAIEFITEARRFVTLLGLVTSARRRDLEIANQKLGIIPWFDVIIHGDHTEHHKPHPEPYLKAIEKLGTPAAQTLVIEDSPNGVISANHAGCLVTGITTNFTEHELLRAGADRIVRYFTEIASLPRQVHPPV